MLLNVLLSVVGYGSQEHYDDEIHKHYTPTLEACVHVCVKKRREEGEEWNGVVWRWWNGGWCWCVKNERGHYDDDDALHYRFS